MKKSIALLVILCFSISTFAQNSFEYIVKSIPYQTFQEQDVIQFNQDDVHSGIINMPFPFDFYEEQAITEFVIGSNGTITFDVAEANTGQDWVINVDEFIPNVGLPVPAILGAYHDIDNSVAYNGGVYSGVTGEAPNRRFHVTFEDIPQFSCNDLLTTFQMILHESSGIIDVVITNKPLCEEWNNGLTVIGIQAMVNDEAHGIAPPGRNTGVWETQEEAWRFIPMSFLNGFNVAICDVDNDANEAFNIDAYKTTIFELFNLDDALNTIAVLNGSGVEVNDDVSIVSGDNSYTIDINNGIQLFDLNIILVNCEDDGDTDGLANGEEDVNGNGDLNDDDTDGDGIPNYLDDDDDGDNVLTNIELVFPDRNNNATATTLDTDGDGIPNHIDLDDDGDGVLTLDEDYNGNGDPTDDDVNENGVPDYLEAEVLNIDAISLNSTLFSVYPIPAKSDINIQFSENIGFEGKDVLTRIYDIQGRLVLEKNWRVVNSRFTVDVSELNSGNYVLLIQKDGLTRAKKFIID
ncbi:T9SS type A sorting domain-containing protein [Psychroserpens ponticola]|uniref:T9SS type A sorting domain-containing protein n=1 Tax=Psychroserpens ponticola TaxID=2932268 RepID=A0ABY7RWA2_9FLAO|nr:T9SS type A sorting domain-containing protein [Psychroserpens ponticola]WCO01037.1 T9SS type A sorting domain-containing protein [Psychroserpens ponticola]